MYWDARTLNVSRDSVWMLAAEKRRAKWIEQY
jgi:hypothetical protein